MDNGNFRVYEENLKQSLEKRQLTGSDLENDLQSQWSLWLQCGIDKYEDAYKLSKHVVRLRNKKLSADRKWDPLDIGFIIVLVVILGGVLILIIFDERPGLHKHKKNKPTNDHDKRSTSAAKAE